MKTRLKSKREEIRPLFTQNGSGARIQLELTNEEIHKDLAFLSIQLGQATQAANFAFKEKPGVDVRRSTKSNETSLQRVGTNGQEKSWGEIAKNGFVQESAVDSKKRPTRGNQKRNEEIDSEKEAAAMKGLMKLCNELLAPPAMKPKITIESKSKAKEVPTSKKVQKMKMKKAAKKPEPEAAPESEQKMKLEGAPEREQPARGNRNQKGKLPEKREAPIPEEKEMRSHASQMIEEPPITRRKEQIEDKRPTSLPLNPDILKQNLLLQQLFAQAPIQLTSHLRNPDSLRILFGDDFSQLLKSQVNAYFQRVSPEAPIKNISSRRPSITRASLHVVIANHIQQAKKTEAGKINYGTPAHEIKAVEEKRKIENYNQAVERITGLGGRSTIPHKPLNPVPTEEDLNYKIAQLQ